jgi:hypothetical protein
MVLPQSNIYFAGTYAIRYYNPAALPPQTAPSEVRVTGLPEAANAIVITWNSMSEVTGYEVSRSDTVEGTYTLIETMTGEYLPNFYTDNDVTTGATYWYKVNAENAHGSGPDSTPVSGSLSAASPSALPNNAGWAIGTLESGTQTDWYTLTAGTAGTYFLQWDDLYNSTGSYTTYVMVSAYRANGIPIFRNTASGYTNPRYLSFGTGETIYVIVASLSGYTGDYAIRYYDPAAVPPQTASLSVQTTGLPPPINGIAIRWNTVDGATDYKIFRSDSEMGTYTSIVTVPHEYPYTYTDIDVTTSVTYWYKVKAVNTYGSGPASAAVSGALSNASPTALPNDATWATGDLITGTQTDWYTLTPGTAGTYYLQGYDHDNSAGSYTAYTSVSAYRANGSLVFGPVGNSSRPLTLDEGETVYVMVATLNSWQTGTYALRYYQ